MIRQWSSIYKDTTELIDASLTWYRSQICDKERVKLNISLFLSLFSRFNILISKRIAFPFLFSFDLDFRRNIFLSFSLSLYLSLVVFSKFRTKDRWKMEHLEGTGFRIKRGCSKRNSDLSTRISCVLPVNRGRAEEWGEEGKKEKEKERKPKTKKELQWAGAGKYQR